MLRRRQRFALLAVAGLVAGIGAFSAGAVSVTPLVLVSGPSPLASCTVGGGPGAVVYTNGEVEPSVAVNPNKPSNLIGAWQQDRWSDGGAHGLVAGFSSNGGKTWGETPLPFAACAPGGLSYERASDPWVSIGPDGTAYAISISFNESNNANAVAAATSTNGGKTWGNLRVLIADNAPNFQFFNDKESITADPTRAGVAYAVWDRLQTPNGNPRASHNTSAFTGPGMFAKTTDGGQSWSTPQVIVPTAQHQQTIANQIVVDPNNGTLYDFFNLINSPNSRPNNVAFVRSTDGGTTWTQPQIVASLLTVGVTDPNTGQLIRTGDIIPEPAIDPTSGRLYVVWQDSRFNGGNFDEVALSTSADGGATWSTPIQVNTNTPSNRPGFTPSVRVSSNGTVGVTYYDFRSLGSETATLPTDYWFTSSADHGGSFGHEVHLAGPFDMLTAPNAVGFFVGDYEGLDTSGTTFVPFFVQANSGNASNPTDVFTANVTP
jgi:hypothetical protein